MSDQSKNYALIAWIGGFPAGPIAGLVVLLISERGGQLWLSFRALRGRHLLTCVSVVLMAACSSPLPGVADDQIVDPDFLGVVKDLDDDGGLWSSANTLAGPGTLLLQDGTSLEVLANTPMSGSCAIFPGSSGNSTSGSCVVYGELAEGRDNLAASLVAMQVVVRDDGLLQAGLADTRSERLVVGPVRGRAGTPVIELSLGELAVLEECVQQGPISIVDEEVVLPDSSEQGYLVAFDPRTFEVQALICN